MRALLSHPATPRVGAVIVNATNVALHALEDVAEPAAQMFWHLHAPDGEVPSDSYLAWFSAPEFLNAA